MVSCFIALGALSLGLWVERQRPGYLLLAGVMLGAAANTKNEGLVAAAIALSVAASWIVIDHNGLALRWWLAALGIVLAAALQWRIWLMAHGVRNQASTSLGDALDAHFLTGRLDRVRLAAEAILAQVADQASWVWLVSAFLVICCVCIAAGPGRRVATFYLATIAADGVRARMGVVDRAARDRLLPGNVGEAHGHRDGLRRRRRTRAAERHPRSRAMGGHRQAAARRLLTM